MKVSLIQQDIVWGDPQANFEHLDKVLQGAEGSDLYVLPEMFSTGFATQKGTTVEKESLAADAAPTEQPIFTGACAGLKWMKRKAAELGGAMAGSIALEQPDGKCVNRFYFVTPDGKVKHYDKRHLFLYGGEGEKFEGGDRRIVYEYGGVRFMLAVCYDLRFPVWLRNRGDYDAMIVVANWPKPRRFAWDTLARARAIENQCYVLAVNRCGEDPACVYTGGTALINPYGETVAAVEDNTEGIASGIIDLKALNEFKSKFPVLDGADDFSINL